MAEKDKVKVKGCPYLQMEPCVKDDCAAWHEWRESPGHRLVHGCKLLKVDEFHIFGKGAAK